MPYAHSYAPARFALELDGVQAGFLDAANGGEAYGDVVEEAVGPDLVVRKQLAAVQYSDIAIECGAGMGKEVYSWIADMLNRKATSKSGAIFALDYAYTARWRLAFSNALLTEVAFPALDGASKDPAHLAVKMTPENTQRSSGSGAKLGGSLTKDKHWRGSNFQLAIDGLDCKRVSRIESIVVRQPLMESPVGEARAYGAEPSALDIGDLVVTLAESHAQDWFAWHDDFVVKGKNSPPSEKTGKLQFLAPNLKDVIVELDFKRLGIHRLATERQQQQADGVSRVRASMYCEEVTFAVPTGWNSGGTVPATAKGGNGSTPPPSGGAAAAATPPSRVEAIAALERFEPETLLPAREGASRIRPI
jgi:hypothetical protein